MKENKLFEALLDVIPFSAYAVDVETYEVVYANKMMVENMYAPREKHCWKKVFGQEDICSWCTIPELKKRKAIYQSKKLLGSFFDEVTDKWFQSYDELVKWPDGRTVRYSISVDITEQKEIHADMIRTHTKLVMQSKKLQEANKKLEFMAQKDFLTTINNRGHFFELVEKIWDKKLEQKENIFVAMLDLDKFKNINDTYGHNSGDLVLKTFVTTVETYLDEDDIFGRLGGEEFGIVFLSNSENSVLEKFEKIREAIENLTLVNKNESIKFTVSIGIVKKDENSSIDVVLDLADKKLYEAKTTGRNQIKFQF